MLVLVYWCVHFGASECVGACMLDFACWTLLVACMHIGVCMSICACILVSACRCTCEYVYVCN